MKALVISWLGSINAHLPQPGSISKTKALGWCVGITLVVMVIEFGASYITKSLMLFSDGLHMLSHALSLGISLGAIMIVAKKSSKKYPFGLGRIEIVAALVNGIGLALFTLYIFYESIVRIIDPVEINISQTLMIAIIGLLVNLSTAWILNLAGLEDLNTKSAFLHLLADTFSSVSIIVGCVIISYTNWWVIDPILSMVVGLVIAKWSYGLIRDATRILLHRVPESINPQNILDHLEADFTGITKVRELKVWEASPNQLSLMAIVVIEHMSFVEAMHIQQNIKQCLLHKYGVKSSYLELEVDAEVPTKNLHFVIPSTQTKEVI